MTGIVLIVVMLGLMWAVVILPQQRRVKAHERLIAGLEPGMVVMTTSGLFGTLVEVGADRVLLEAAEGHRLVIDRRSIGMIAPAGTSLAELADVSVATPPPVDPASLAAPSSPTSGADTGANTGEDEATAATGEEEATAATEAATATDLDETDGDSRARTDGPTSTTTEVDPAAPSGSSAASPVETPPTEKAER